VKCGQKQKSQRQNCSSLVKGVGSGKLAKSREKQRKAMLFQLWQVRSRDVKRILLLARAAHDIACGQWVLICCQPKILQDLFKKWRGIREGERDPESSSSCPSRCPGEVATCLFSNKQLRHSPGSTFLQDVGLSLIPYFQFHPPFHDFQSSRRRWLPQARIRSGNMVPRTRHNTELPPPRIPPSRPSAAGTSPISCQMRTLPQIGNHSAP